MSEKRIMRMPLYMKNFKCIGSKCEDNCCIGWDVDIDKNTYKKYNQIKEVELKKLIKKYVYFNDFPFNGNIDFGKVELLQDKRCPFLNVDKLCKIQSKLGEGYLSNVCATYPRTINILNDVFEYSLDTSCPEAARLILLNPAGIQFSEETFVKTRNIISDSFNTNDILYKNSPVRYLEEIRNFTILTLQSRNYLLWQRLLILGYFFQELQKYIQNKRVNDIVKLIDNYTNKLNEGFFNESISKNSIAYPTQLTLMKILLDKLNIFSEIDSKSFVSFTKELLKGIGYKETDTSISNGKRYEIAYQKFYLPFIKEREYILENYLVNLVFKNLFPFSETDKPYDSYMMLVIRYTFIKLYLSGIGAFHNGLSEELVVALIQSFSKTAEHHRTYFGEIVHFIKQKKYNTIESMALLLCN